MRKYLGLIAVFAIAFTACNTNQFKGFDKTESGLYYKFHTRSGDTTLANDDDMISMFINYRRLDDSVFYSTPTEKPVDLHMRASDYQGDIFDGLKMMNIGDSATFVVSTDSLFSIVYKSEIPDYLDSGSYFYFDVKVVDILNKDQQAQKRMEEMAKLQAKEMLLVKGYLKDNNIVVLPDSNGIYKTITKKGSGKVVAAGNYTKINLRFNLLDNPKALFDSWVNAQGKGIDIMVGTGYFGLGLDNCLLGAKEGETFTAVMPSAMAFGSRGVERIVPPYSPLAFECEVISTKTEAQRNKELEDAKVKQQAELSKYLKKNNINPVPDADGIYKTTEVVGTGATPMAGDKVKVLYTGTFLDGKKFDSSVDRDKPFEFAVATGAVIPGWDKALSTMKIGEKAIFIIPSSLAYGTQGSGPIPPNSTLVFEIELLSIEGK